MLNENYIYLNGLLAVTMNLSLKPLSIQLAYPRLCIAEINPSCWREIHTEVLFLGISLCFP